MTAPFLGEDFLLHSKAARELYHGYAADMPIFDYHCHLDPEQIAEDRVFQNMTQVWLDGDHYKWRAMRANGVPERLITGDATAWERFEAWAATVPATLRNPLYHWTHMELKRPFGIEGVLLGPETAGAVWDRCNACLAQPAFSARGLMRQFHVKVACTTDDPADSLSHHIAIAQDPRFGVKVLPTFRPDRAMAIDAPERFNQWVAALEAAAGVFIKDFTSFMEALDRRHEAFHAAGCRLSDHGQGVPCAEEATAHEIRTIFNKVRAGHAPDRGETRQFASSLMRAFGRMDAARGWTMQLHMGALRNANTRMFRAIGPDTGFDAIGDGAIADALARFLDGLDRDGRLPRTILYVLNPRDNDMIAALIGSFQDGSVPGKMQFGSGWWFNDHKDGMERQINALSAVGLLSRCVGMLTDSRSFLSYPRHDYFRRILCNLLGGEAERGELPGDMALLGGIVRDICFENARRYFGIDVP